MKTTRGRIADNMHIIWSIASKDIVDSLRNKLTISLILGMGFMLLMPKVMGIMLVPPETPVLVYDPGNSRLTTALEDNDYYQVQRVKSTAEVEQVIGSTGFGLGVEFGLAVPDDFDQILEIGGHSELRGFIAWANRMKASQLKADLEKQIEELLGQPVPIKVEGNIVYPPADSGLWLLMVVVTPVIMC